ncbi:cytochrome c oxidase assembly protein [Aquisediminimonas sediminicola]|uniref:cytochrome c oxidase assembly protein n=1 Tax=Alteraquisediminimonas sediminicola TaxID=2676787 RepID=UPI001C8E0721
MTALAQRNAKTGALAGLLAVAMIALGFAAVPIYRIFCQVTGFGGTTMRVAESALPAKPVGKILSIRFDSNVAEGMPWHFVPEKFTDNAAIGARKIAIYTAKNLSSAPITGRATFNVTPIQAGKYFSKIQCFCFTEQTLKAGQEVRMPVTYFVDPKIMDDPDTKDISEITLSYTFYPVDQSASGR